jgi:septal ring factor EnvC (AmiA/AmiB activator)
MEWWMNNQIHARFQSANQKLRDFLRRAEGLATRSGTVTERDLKQFSLRLITLAPEIGDASRSATLDTSLQQEIAEYVKNLRALQGALERVRCVMLARQVQLGAAKGRMDGLQGWVDLDPQTT